MPGIGAIGFLSNPTDARPTSVMYLLLNNPEFLGCGTYALSLRCLQSSESHEEHMNPAANWAISKLNTGEEKSEMTHDCRNNAASGIQRIRYAWYRQGKWPDRCGGFARAGSLG